MISPHFLAYHAASGPLQDHPRCAKCGYDLHLLTPGARCPECGLAVWKSLRPDHIDESTAGWRRRISWGARLTALGLVVLIVALWRALTTDALGPAEGTLIGVSAGLVSLGGWLLGSSENRHGRTRPRPMFRRTLRIGAGLVAMFGVVFVSDRFLGHAALRPTEGLLSFIVIPWLVLLLWHVRSIARRGMSRKLHRWTVGLMLASLAGSVIAPLLVLRPAGFPLRITPHLIEEVGWVGMLYCVAAVAVLWLFADACADVPLHAEDKQPSADHSIAEALLG